MWCQSTRNPLSFGGGASHQEYAIYVYAMQHQQITEGKKCIGIEIMRTLLPVTLAFERCTIFMPVDSRESGTEEFLNQIEHPRHCGTYMHINAP